MTFGSEGHNSLGDGPGAFDIYATYQLLLQNDQVCPKVVFTAGYHLKDVFLLDIGTFGCHTRFDWIDRAIEWWVDEIRRDAHILLIPRYEAGTMFELVKALNDGAEALKKRTPNPISLNAGCELFIAFVTLFPHDSDVSLCIAWAQFLRD